MTAGKWIQARQLVRRLVLTTTIAVGAIVLAGWTSSAEAATPYTTSAGDTFWKLSQRYDIPLKKLISFNPHVNERNVYAGLKLTLPASSTPAGVKAQLAIAAKQAASASRVTTMKAPAATMMAAKAAVTTAKAEAPADYKKAFQAKASAYTSAAEENGWGPIDYFGNPLKVGTVAVDPKVIPLGSKLFISGYDYAGLPAGGMYATATDTGSSIKGKRIDIFVPDSRKEAMNFGFQYVIVYVL
jgi:3D (Asp-Asp-Asp) domain-containing protein